MSEQIDPDFLKHEEYGQASDLSTRIQIQRRYSTHPRSWFLWLFDRLQLPSQSRILELGCGPGDLWLENLDRLPEGWEITLSDLSLGMLQEARKRFLGKMCRATFSLLNVQAIPFEEDYFDAVIGIGLLDHVPGRVEALDEVRRVLKRGGIFFASAGGRSHLQEIEDLVRPWVPDADYGGDPDRFGLENGAKLLSPWFRPVRTYGYEDRLVFKQVGPVIDYGLSEAKVKSALIGEKLAAFRESIEQKLSSQGEIVVTTQKGLFEAQKPRI